MAQCFHKPLVNYGPHPRPGSMLIWCLLYIFLIFSEHLHDCLYRSHYSETRGTNITQGKAESANVCWTPVCFQSWVPHQTKVETWNWCFQVYLMWGNKRTRFHCNSPCLALDNWTVRLKVRTQYGSLMSTIIHYRAWQCHFRAAVKYRSII